MPSGAASASASSTSTNRVWREAGAAVAEVVEMMSCLAMGSGSLAEQAGGFDQQHHHHDHEDDGGGGLGIEHLGQSLQQAEQEAGDHRAQDRAHAADHHHRE